jgi:hypothetical protein
LIQKNIKEKKCTKRVKFQRRDKNVNKCMSLCSTFMLDFFMAWRKICQVQASGLTKCRAITASRKVWVDRVPFSILPCRWQVRKIY